MRDAQDLSEEMWLNPLFIRLHKEQEQGSKIYHVAFSPLDQFGESGKITPIEDENVLYYYMPSKEIVEAKNRFLETLYGQKQKDDKKVVHLFGSPVLN